MGSFESTEELCLMALKIDTKFKGKLICASKKTPCPSAPARCAPVASPVNKFSGIASPVPNYACPVINE